MPEPTHTPLPWRYSEVNDEITTSPLGICEGSKTICRHLKNQFKPEDEWRANVAFILLACNNFPLTVQAFTDIIASKTLMEAKFHANKAMFKMQKGEKVK